MKKTYNTEAIDEVNDAADNVEAAMHSDTLHVDQHAEGENPGLSGSEGFKDEPKDNQPTLQQASLTVCGMFVAELQQANQKYPPMFNSSKEAYGVLDCQYQDVREMLALIKSVQGNALDQASFDAGQELKMNLVQLGAMCIKAAYSLTNLHEDCEKFSASIGFNVTAQEILNTEEAGE